MKIYYSFDTSRILTEEEATKYIKEELSDDDDYGIWEFISNNYCCDEVMENLPQDFLENVTEKLIKNRLENPDYFLVREFPD